jgi:phosphoribosylcarboxyaminoimidazole (NCAIR) mutase
MKAVIIMGSTSDQGHADKITGVLDELGVNHETHAASAHKIPERVLEIIRSVGKEESVIFVTIAGRSNDSNKYNRLFFSNRPNNF